MTESALSLWLVAGEASGDQHGATLARALRDAAGPSLVLRGIGGPLMRAAGVDLVADVTARAATGIVEVLRAVPFFWRLLRRTRADILRERPAAAVLIDFPEFNLRLARCVGREVPVVYYIPPQLWAWRTGRVRAVRAFVRRAVVVFPFEELFYKRHGVDCVFVGHPLVDAVAQDVPADLAAERGLDRSRRWIGLLPGSRRAEFAHHWPLFREAAARVHRAWPETGFLLSVTPAVPVPAEAAEGHAPFPLVCVRGRGRDVLRAAEAALVASGTATLEAALLGCPHVAAYRMHPATHWLAKRLVKVPHFALPNVVAGRRIVPELAQDAATPEALADALLSVARDPGARARVRRDLADAARSLGGAGAAARAARAVLETAGFRGDGA